MKTNPMPAPRTARRTHEFTESVIREMTRVTGEYDAINLAQGFPDFPAPEMLKEAACEAIRSNRNQYAITWGSPRLRNALVTKYREWYGLEVEGDQEITVTCGATEAMAAVMLAVIDPGDEVIILQPFYENYGPDAILCGAQPVFLPLAPPDYRLDTDRLASLVTDRTRAIVVNTPNNPTGRVLDRSELEAIAALCLEHDLLAITDEIYERADDQNEMAISGKWIQAQLGIRVAVLWHLDHHDGAVGTGPRRLNDVGRRCTGIVAQGHLVLSFYASAFFGGGVGGTRDLHNQPSGRADDRTEKDLRGRLGWRYGSSPAIPAGRQAFTGARDGV